MALAAMIANAQPGQQFNPEQRVQNLMTAVKSQMTLTPEKLSQVEKLYLGYYNELQEMRQASQGSFDREKMVQKREKLSESLLTVLTQEEHDKLIEVERSLRRPRRPGGGNQ